MLIDLAQALQQAVRAEDAVGRFGGDKFLVLANVRDAAGVYAAKRGGKNRDIHCAAPA